MKPMTQCRAEYKLHDAKRAKRHVAQWRLSCILAEGHQGYHRAFTGKKWADGAVRSIRDPFDHDR